MNIFMISSIEENAFTGRPHGLIKGRKFNWCKTYVLLCVLYKLQFIMFIGEVNNFLSLFYMYLP